MGETVYLDFQGKNPITRKALKSIILEGDFLAAWYAVSVYIMKMDISPFHMTLMRHRISSKNTLTMAGRGLGKSHLLTESYCLTLILRDHDIAIAIITRIVTQAKAFVSVLMKHLEPDGLAYSVFGDLRDKDKWSSEQFKLRRKTNRLESTVTAASIASTGRTVSKHYDVLILDDIADSQNSSSKKIRDDMEKSFYQNFVPAMHPQSEYQYIHIVGTHYHPDDIYIRLEAKKTFKTLKIPAMYEDDAGQLRCVWDNVKEDAVNRILDMKDSNPLAYEQQYQQIVRKGDGGIFNPEWLQHFNKLIRDDSGIYAYISKYSKLQEEDSPVVEERRKLKLYAGVDLAITQKTNSDYFVFAVIGVDDKKNIYLLDFDRGRYTFNQQLEALVKMGNKWPELSRIGIESVAYQQALLQEANRTTDLPVVKLKTLTDKITRLNSFSALFENGKVFIYNHMRNTGDLVSEFLEFPDGEHDDIPDAFCMAWELQKTRQKKGGIAVPTN